MKKGKKNPTQYSIDLDFKGMFLFLLLAVLTGCVIFYLGMIYGKASRDPNRFAAVSMQDQNTSQNAEPEISNKDLEIYNIRNDAEHLKNLKNESKNLLEEADRVIMESQQQIEVDNKVNTPPKAQTPAPTKETKAQWPNNAQSTSKQQDIYTVQIFATKDQDKADRIVRLLRKQEFDAYLVSVTIDNQLIYRVRVGRRNKEDITKLDRDLKKVIGGMGMKSRIIKIQ